MTLKEATTRHHLLEVANQYALVQSPRMIDLSSSSVETSKKRPRQKKQARVFDCFYERIIATTSSSRVQGPVSDAFVQEATEYLFGLCFLYERQQEKEQEQQETTRKRLSFHSVGRLLKELRDVEMEPTLDLHFVSSERLTQQLFEVCHLRPEEDEKMDQASFHLCFHTSIRQWLNYTLPALVFNKQEEIKSLRFVHKLRLLVCHNWMWTLWFCVYLCTVIFAFVYKFFFHGRPNIPFASITHGASGVAKGFAQLTLIHALYLMLPMSRQLVLLARKSSWILPIFQTEPAKIHMFLGTVLLSCGLSHGIAHLFVFHRVSNFCQQNCMDYFALFTDGNFGAYKKGFVTGINDTVHIDCECDISWESYVFTLPVLTGFLMFFIALTLVCLSSSFIRKKQFHWFEKSHKLLALAFVFCFCIHGIKGWIEPTQAFFYIMIPLGLILFERRKRFFCWKKQPIPMQCNYSPIVPSTPGRPKNSSTKSAGGILELTIQPPKGWPTRSFARPGSFVYLNVPQVSRAEWHPFTILYKSLGNQEPATVVPTAFGFQDIPEERPPLEDTQNVIRLHVRVRGDWTTKVLETSNRATNDKHQVKIDMDSHHDMLSNINRGPSRSSVMVLSMATDPNIPHRQTIVTGSGECAGAAPTLSNSNDMQLKCHLDGPIEGLATNCYHYKTLVYAAGGVGISVFLSLLEDIFKAYGIIPSATSGATVSDSSSSASKKSTTGQEKKRHTKKPTNKYQKIKKIHLIWIARHVEDFQIFVPFFEKLFSFWNLYDPLSSTSCPPPSRSTTSWTFDSGIELELSTFLTSVQMDPCPNVSLWQQLEYECFQSWDALTGLMIPPSTPNTTSRCIRSGSIRHRPTQMGRPQWKQVLHHVVRSNSSGGSGCDNRIGVFVCGSKAMGQQIRTSCQQLDEWNQFDVYTEGF